MDYLRIASELAIGYVALLLLTKFLGKTQMSQITAFDFISVLVLGELVGNALYDDNIGISKILFAVVLWALLIYFTELITQKYRKSRPLLEGYPSIVIRQGKIDYDVLKKNHVDINQLQLLLRQNGIFSIQECEYAILETNGLVSTLKKPNYDSITRNDLQIKVSPPELPITLILDGEVLIENLQAIDWNVQRLKDEITKQGFNELKDILFAEWKASKGLYIQSYVKTTYPTTTQN